ncbi:MAG: poly-gamma-glutamate synthase PgsB [Actinomycetota bacterium]
MPREFWIVAALAGALAAALHLEWWRHRRALARVPVRIHVNGTRGKSSVTRLIASILRDQGIPTVAKTTGTSPRLILLDGSEVPVPRDGPPNISELIWATGRAARLGARALVFECMAVDPDLQWVAENRIVQPTITVITNARLDHTDVQGSDPRAIAASFPMRWGGTMVTADPLVAAVHEPKARAAGGSVHLADEDSVGADELRRMGYLEHPANVALALEVARLLGISRPNALRGLEAAVPDPGVATVLDLTGERGPWTLVNLFAANDSESTFLALDTADRLFGLPGRPIILFVSRGDRSARSAEFATALAANQDRYSRVVVWGQKTRAMARRTRAAGVPAGVVVDAGTRPPEALTALLEGEMDGARTVVGVGNIIGPGQRWLSSLADGIDREAASPREGAVV